MMTNQEQLMGDVTRHVVFGKPQQNDLSEKSLLATYNGRLELTQEELVNEQHHKAMTQKVKGLLETGDFEKALSLACEFCHDSELGKDPVFLETALILMTNMEKMDCMWKEVKTLNSMEQLYSAAKTLIQYYMPAALLTAEMILCKEWCDKNVCGDDLQQITSLWVSCLWAQSGHDKEAFETKILKVAKHILREPTFVLNLVKAICAEVGNLSLVVCVNLCLLVIQMPLRDPQNNPINASRIDTNNTALCSQLAELVTEDTSLQRLCLLTAFTITPTKELFAEVDRLYKSNTVSSPTVPLLPSCLSCLLVQCMHSLLPDSICPQVNWHYLRGKCLKYLEMSSVLNLQVKLPDQQVNLKMYIKENDEVDDNDTNTEGRDMSSVEAGVMENLSEKMELDSLDALHTEAELQWLASMMSLDMSWEPPWLENNEEHLNEVPSLRDGRISTFMNHSLSGPTAQGSSFNPTPCTVVLTNLDMLNQSHSSRVSCKDNVDRCQSTVEITQASSFKDDHAYSLPPTWLSEEEIPKECLSGDSRHSTENVAKMDLDYPAFSKNRLTEDGVVIECESVNFDGLSDTAETSPLVEWMNLSVDDLQVNQEDPIQRDNVTLDDGLENLANELSYVEGTSSQVSPEHRDKLAAGTSFHRSHNFLQDIREFDSECILSRNLYDSISMTDGDQSELSYDARRWFESIDQPSETSSIVGAEVTPDPVTEQTMQWTAIKSINEDETQTMSDLSWNKLDLWLSHDPHIGPTGQPDLPTCSSSVSDTTWATSTSHSICNAKVVVESGKYSLENTINKLRANLSTADKNLDSFESQSSKQQEGSLRPLFQNAIEQRLAKETTANSPQFVSKFSSTHSGHRLKPNKENPNQVHFNSEFVDQTPTSDFVAKLQHMEADQLSNDSQSDILAASHQQAFNQCSLTSPQSTYQRSTDGVSVTQQLSACYFLNQLPGNQLPGKPINGKTGKTDLSPQLQEASSSSSFKMMESNNQTPLSSIQTGHAETRKVTNQITFETVDRHFSEQLPSDFLTDLTESSNFILARDQVPTENTKTRQNHHKQISLENHSTVAHASKITSKLPASVVKCPLQNELPKPRQNSVREPRRVGPKMDGLMLLVSAATEEFAMRTRTSLHTQGKQNGETRRTQPSTRPGESEIQNVNHGHLARSMDGSVGSSLKNQDKEVHERKEITPVATQSRVGNSLLAGSGCSCGTEETQVKLLNVKPDEMKKISDQSKVLDSVCLNTSCDTDKFKHSSENYTSGVKSQRHNISAKEMGSEVDSKFEVVQDVTCRWSTSGKKRETEFSRQHEEANKLKKTRERTVVSPNKRKDGPEVRERLDCLEKNAIKNCSPPHEEKRGPEEFSGKVQVLPPKEVDCEKMPSGAKTDFVRNEMTGKVQGKPTSVPPTRRYSLRATSHVVNYFVQGSSTDAEISSEPPSGDDGQTRSSYFLRSLNLRSGRVAAVKRRKMPRRTSRTSRKAPQGKPKGSNILPSGKCKRRKTFGVRRRRGKNRKKSSGCKALTRPNMINDCDQNNNQLSSDQSKNSNNCCNGKIPSTNRNAHQLSLSKGLSSRFTGGFQSAFPSIQDPPLPWETKPPLRTYSSKKNSSSL